MIAEWDGLTDFLVDLAYAVGLLTVLVCVYFAPTIVAFSRDITNKWSVAIVNLFLGWTLVGWVVALAMAARTKTQPTPTA